MQVQGKILRTLTLPAKGWAPPSPAYAGEGIKGSAI
jgi:hypothetical protein